MLTLRVHVCMRIIMIIIYIKNIWHEQKLSAVRFCCLEVVLSRNLEMLPAAQATSFYSPRVTSVCSQQGKQKRRREAGPSHPGEKRAWGPWASVAPLAVPEEVGMG